MNKTLIWVIVAIVVIGGGWYLMSNQKPKEATGEPIKIGVVLGITGYAATDSLNVQRGLEMAKEDLAKKGINVELLIQDDGTDPKKTISAVQYLVQNEKPRALIGPIWSFLEDAAAPTIAQAKIVSFPPADTSEFSASNPYIFHGAVKHSQSIPAISKWLKEKNIKKVAIITSKDPWGVSVAEVFEKGAKDAGTTVVLNEGFQSVSGDTSAVSTVLSKARAKGAEAILVTGYDEVGTAIVKKRQELKLNIPMLAQATFFEQLLSRGLVSKEQLQGVDYLSIPTTPQFIEKFKAKYGQAPGNYSDRAYDGLMILVEAIQKNPNGTGDDLANYIRNSVDYQGYGGRYRYDEKGDLKDGEWVVKPVVQ